MALAAAVLLCGCELPAPKVRVKARAVANVHPVYMRMVVLFRFYRNGKPVHEAVSPVSDSPSETSYDTELGPNGKLGMAAGVYWDEGEGKYVPVTKSETRQLTFSEANNGAVNGEYTWRANMDFTIGE